ncbi:MAG: hypothetical protein RL755_12 [Pseudomonadota bacterium]|jgi:hypothetical protein
MVILMVANQIGSKMTDLTNTLFNDNNDKSIEEYIALIDAELLFELSGVFCSLRTINNPIFDIVVDESSISHSHGD